LLATVAIALSGCGKTVEGTIAQVCGPNGWREITVGRDDHITDPTAREIVGNNKARSAWCDKRAEA
jgi:hypothetical protein